MYFDQRCCRGASAKGGGALNTRRAFFGAPKPPEGYFRGAEGASKIWKILLFHRKNQYFRRKYTIFTKIFQNFVSKKNFLQKKYFSKNLCKKKFFFKFFFKKIFKNFSKILKIFEKLSLKNAKKSIFGAFWWVTKTTRGNFFPSPKPPGGKNRERSPYNISDFDRWSITSINLRSLSSNPLNSSSWTMPFTIFSTFFSLSISALNVIPASIMLLQISILHIYFVVRKRYEFNVLRFNIQSCYVFR